MLRRNLIANYLGQGWTALMSLAFVPLYIRYLGIESYGLIGFFAMLQGWLALLDMGMAPTLGREMARFTGGGGHTPQSIRDLLRTVETVGLAIAALAALLVALMSGWLAGTWLQVTALPVSVAAQAFTVMGLVIGLRFVEGLYRSSIIGLQRQVLLNAVTSAMATLRGLGAVGMLAWWSPTLQAFFWWQVAASVTTVAALSALTYSALPAAGRRARFSMAALRDVWQFAGGMFGITLLATLLTQVDKLLLSRLLGLGDYGRYALASLVAGAPLMLIIPVTQAWLPRLTQLQAAGDQDGLAAAFHQGAQLVSIVLGASSLQLLTFAEPLLQLWTRDAELARRTAPLLALLAVGNLLNGLMWIPYQTQLAHGWTGLAVRTNIVAVCLIVPAILWATPRYGAVGAAWVWIALNAGYVTFSAAAMFRRILGAERRRWYLNDLLLPVLPAALVCVAAARLQAPSPDPYVECARLLLVLIAAAAAAAIASDRVRGRFAVTFRGRPA